MEIFYLRTFKRIQRNKARVAALLFDAYKPAIENGTKKYDKSFVEKFLMLCRKKINKAIAKNSPMVSALGKNPLQATFSPQKFTPKISWLSVPYFV